MEQAEYKFDTKISQMIKGVAIIIMVFHHLFGNLDWILETSHFVSIPMLDYSLEYYLAVPGKICISIYAFLSGYGLYASYTNRKQKVGDVIKRVFSVLLNWWLIVLVCFLPLALVCGQTVDGRLLLNNLLLTGNSWCPFADYLLFYITAIITYPFIYWLLHKVNKPLLFFIGTPLVGMVVRKGIEIIIPQGIVYQLLYFYFLYIAYIVAGSCVYQSGIFRKFHYWMSGKVWNKIWIKSILLLCIFPARWMLNNKLAFDSFLATIVVFLLTEIFQECKNTKVLKQMEFLGKHSTNIWFLHAIFFFSFAKYTQWIVYIPRIPVVILLWCILCCLPVSWIINLLHGKLWGVMTKK